MSLTCSEPLEGGFSPCQTHPGLPASSPKQQPCSLLEVYSGLLEPQSLAPHGLSRGCCPQERCPNATPLPASIALRVTKNRGQALQKLVFDLNAGCLLGAGSWKQ